MAITFSASGGQATGTTSITPGLPGGSAAGQLAILQVVSGHPDDSMPTTPSGWTLAGSSSGGGGTFGSGTGPRRLTWFIRILAGSDANPTVTLAAGTGATLGGRIVTLSRSAGVDWRWAATFGEDTTSGTGFSAACSTALTFTSGDFILLGYALPDGTADTSAQGITATGITFGAVTERGDGATGTGNNARNAEATASVTAGTGTVAPTVTATLSVASTGAAGVLRIREASSDVTAAPQSVFPPRNLVSATGLAADDITSVTLYREVGTTLTPVRAASAVDVTGANDLLRVDAEQPFGVSVTYKAELTDVNGTVWEAFSGPITSTVDSDVISDAIRGVGAKVTIASWPEKRRDRDATQFNVGGRIVVVSRPRSSASATVTVRTQTTDAGDALQDVLDEATEGIILIRKRTTLAGADTYLVVLSDAEDRNWFDAVRRWALDSVETEAWPDVLEAAGFTLQDIADNFTTLQDIADFFPGTLLAIAQYDFGV